MRRTVRSCSISQTPLSFNAHDSIGALRLYQGGPEFSRSFRNSTFAPHPVARGALAFAAIEFTNGQVLWNFRDNLGFCPMG